MFAAAGAEQTTMPALSALPLPWGGAVNLRVVEPGGDPPGHGVVLGQLGISAAEALAQLRAPRIAEQRLLIHVAHDVMSRLLQSPRR